MLSKFENNVEVIESRTTTFCNNQVDKDGGLDSYSFLGFAGINSSYVKPSEQLEITAAAGYFNNVAQPVITINSGDVPVDYDGISHYRFNAPDKPGKYSVLVKIAYKDEVGKEQTMRKTIKYTVAADK
jgi:hypothetical protein